MYFIVIDATEGHHTYVHVYPLGEKGGGKIINADRLSLLEVLHVCRQFVHILIHLYLEWGHNSETIPINILRIYLFITTKWEWGREGCDKDAQSPGSLRLHPEPI